MFFSIYFSLYLKQVFCTEPTDLLAVAMAHRGLSPNDVDAHVGIDGGQGWLKIGLTLTKRCEINNNKRAKYEEVIFCINVFCIAFLKGVASKQAKGSSVKKLFLLGVLPELPESYESVKVIMRNLNMDAFEFVTSADLKMGRNIFTILFINIFM